VSDLKERLDAAWKLYRAGKYRDPVFAELEKANYAPAKALFRAMLGDKNARIRTRGLTHLQLMKNVSSDREILDKVREIVVNDPNDLTRQWAALLLAGHSRWPDEALKRALAKETDPSTKEAIFLAVLELMTSWDFADSMRSDVQSESIELTLKSAEKLAKSYKKGK
jgi:hypothetical protein